MTGAPSFLGTLTEAGETTPVTARGRVEAEGLGVQADDGRALHLPFAELTLEQGGFDGELLYCRWPARQVVFASSDRGLRAALEACAHPALASQLARARSTRRRRGLGRWIAAGLVLAAVGGIVALLLQVPRLLAATVDALPVEIDRSLGEAAWDEASLPGPVSDDPALQGFVDEIVARLAPHAAVAGFDLRPIVVESDEPNAFALPGGRMVVLTGLIRIAERPEEVAGVMAHEIAHVTLRHGLRNVAAQAGTFVALQLILGDAEAWVQLAGEAARTLGANAYSREQESAADEEGVRMMAAAGLDPLGLAAFFERLSLVPGTALGGPLSWLSTHPEHEARVAHVRSLLGTLPAAPRRPLGVDWDVVKAAAGGADEDESDRVPGGTSVGP